MKSFFNFILFFLFSRFFIIDIYLFFNIFIIIISGIQYLNSILFDENVESAELYTE